MLPPRIAALLATPDAPLPPTPLIEGNEVHFLWRGEADRVRAWFAIEVELTRIPGTDLWHGSETYPPGFRTLYCLLLGDTPGFPSSPDSTGPALLDPTNPSRLHFPADPADPSDREAWMSVLELPGAPTSPWLTGQPRGKLEVAAFTSASFAYAVTTSAYLPPGHDGSTLPALIVFDGYLARTAMAIPTALDNLIAAGRIPPMGALFVHSREASRDHDLTPGPALERMVVDELLPFARSTWNLGTPHRTIAAGMSRGGLAATSLALARPDIFSAAIAHSGSFWWPAADPGRLIREAAATASPETRFYLDVGTIETAEGPDGAPPQLTVCRAMRDTLRARGCPVSYAEFAGGHDYINWRHNFPDALIAVTA